MARKSKRKSRKKSVSNKQAKTLPAVSKPAVTNRYEAAFPSKKRGTIGNRPVSARKDITPYTRTAGISKGRALEQNSGFAQMILETVSKYTIGTGINPIPATEDEEFNKRALQSWNQWCAVCCVDSREHFYEIEAKLDNREFVDGDIFTLLVTNERGLPRIQVIEGHMCGSVYNHSKKTGELKEVDGIEYDDRGRAIKYRFFEDFSDSLNVLAGKRAKSVGIQKDAEYVVHHVTQKRASQGRGISAFMAVLKDFQDLEELLDAEMQTQKANAKLRDVITNENGEVDPDPTKSRYNLEEDTVTVGEDEVTRQSYYEEQIDAKTVVLKHGDKHELAYVNRPGGNWLPYVKLNMQRICGGCGVSYDLVVEGGTNGVALRLAMEKDARFFEKRAARRINEFRRIYEFVIGRHIDLGLLKLPSKGFDWKPATWSPPRQAKIDVGRDPKAITSGLLHGYRSLHDVCGEVQVDWRKKLREKAENMAEAAKLAAEFSKDGIEITAEQILALDPNEISAKAGEEESSPTKGTKEPEED
ncbi:phage portal protein [Puniceicoccaceae bacterium K14]|nr:phage portal protein [Puniceicoccaceae bacterium K14]